MDTLALHCDVVSSLVVSSIVHIAHEYDNPNEPWTLDIEDHNEKLHHIALNEGKAI